MQSEDTNITTQGLSEAKEKLQYLTMNKADRLAYERHLDAIMVQEESNRAQLRGNQVTVRFLKEGESPNCYSPEGLSSYRLSARLLKSVKLPCYSEIDCIFAK